MYHKIYVRHNATIGKLMASNVLPLNEIQSIKRLFKIHNITTTLNIVGQIIWPAKYFATAVADRELFNPAIQVVPNTL